MWCFLLLTLFVTVQGRAVNISNTWVLPEEGFPVFYRYFRDRISWYEADAVCQFHHANLVTVDTTAQYDAVRAYLKELDISSAVWVGLIRSNPDGDFTWTDYRGLSGDGYWSAAPDSRSAPLCAAADPAADYRWEARACGGPSVASFICELPVPQWALGNEGCMVRALPALTVLYLPESAAVQLTADCGLAGVKKVQCTGNVKREALLRELSCTEEDQTTTSPIITTPLLSWQTATDATISDDSSNEVNTEENITTEHEDDINQSTSIKIQSTLQNSLLSTTEQSLETQSSLINKLHKTPLEKNINLDIIHNNLLHDNEKLPNNDDLFTNIQSKKLEDEKQIQHKKLHSELARLGNLETIFSQPMDHFVPPLVMAKAKISDDMTALSIEEKLAQQLSEHNSMQRDAEIEKDVTSTETTIKDITTENGRNDVSFSSTKTSDRQYIDYTKYLLPKKYTKADEIKSKTVKNIKLIKNSKSSADTTLNADVIDTTTVKSHTQNFHASDIPIHVEEDTSLELTVIIKEPRLHDEDNYTQENNSQTELQKRKEHNLPANLPFNNLQPIESLVASPIEHQVIMNDEVIKIEIINKNSKHPNIDVTVFEVTTKVPVSQNIFKDNTDNEQIRESEQPKLDAAWVNNVSLTSTSPEVSANDLITAHVQSAIDNVTISDASTQTTGATLITIVTDLNTEVDDNLAINDKDKNNTEESIILYNATITENNYVNNETDITDSLEKNMTDTTPEIDDFQSPLLSAANEPLHKPIRSRRPQSLQNRPNKFNPFRILG